MSKRIFEAILEGTPDYPQAAFVRVPFDVEAEYGKKRVKIKALIDGIPYRGSLVRMGTPYHILLVKKAIRTQLGKQHGDTVRIELEEDTEPRVVEIPQGLAAAFKAEADIQSFFEKLSYTHQKEYVQWITSAKREETRQRRLKKAIQMLRERVKHP